MKKFLLMTCMWVAFAMTLSGQTTLISPTGDGGFENGATFALNNWTVVNHTTNTWQISGVAVPYAGTNSAFISNDGGTSYSYTNTLSQTSHFYRDVTVPAGESSITLSFQWKGNGESGWDRLLIYTAPTSVTPVAGIPVSSSTALTGATLVYTQSVFPQAAYGLQTITLSSSLAGTTFRLILTWQNDASGGTNPPVSVDNISLVSDVPPPPLTGIKTIDPAGSGANNYFTFTAAINALNINGVGTGGVTFNVASGNTFTEDPPAITATGTAANPIVFQKSGGSSNPVISATGGAGTSDAGIIITGGDYITFNGIDISATGTTLEYGYLIRNASATDGALYNSIRNAKISLDRTNTSSIGILQTASTSFGGGITPASTAGANAFNTYYNITVENSYHGIWLYGNSTYYDSDCQIGITGGGTTTIGATTANDIGNGTSTSYGIRTYYQKNLSVFNTEIRNVTTTTSGSPYGISVELSQGTSLVYNNKIHDIKTTGTSTASIVYGISASASSTVGDKLNIYNNALYAFDHGITSASATIVHRTLNFTAGNINVYYNSARIDEDAIPSSALLYLASGTFNVNNNILASFSTGGATSKRFCYYVSFGTISSSSNNLLYIDGTLTNNFVGYGSAGDRASLQAFAASISPAAPVIGLEGGSGNADPIFTSASNLTFAGSTPARYSGIPVTGITTDINGTARDASRPTMGAYETTQGQNDKSAPSFSNVSITSGLSPVVSVTLTDNSSSVNNATIRLWYRLQGSSVAYTGLDADAKPTGAMNGTYTWNTALAALAQGTYQFYIAARDDQGAGFGIWVYPMWATTWAGWAAGDPPNFTANPDVAANANTFTRQVNLAGGTYEVGDDQPVLKKLTDVAAQLNSSILLGNIIYEMNSSYNGATGETYPIVFNQYTSSGGNWTVTIRVKDATSARTTSGNTANPLIRLNGADNMTFDGRAGGTGSTIAWTIQNTNTGGNAFTFINDAQSNTIQYCDLISVNNTTSLGVIIFGTTTGTSGNDNNTVTYCNIHDDGTNFPLYGIYSLGTSTTLNTWNSGITISNNNIYNFYINGGNPVGIYLAGGSTQWTVTGNSFYQTATRTPTVATGFNVILMGTGDGHTVSGNFLGGSAPSCGGTPWTVSGTTVANFIYGIRFGTMLLTNVNSLQGNTISNISMGSNPATAGIILFDGILISSGICNIGNITPNIIGSGSATGAITITLGSSANTSTFLGLDFRGPSGVVQNNVIGGFTLSGSTTSVVTFAGLYIPPTNLYGTFTVSGNTVGSTTTANSIQCPSAANPPIQMYGIWVFPQSGYGTVNISSNTVANITNNSTNSTSFIQGIRSSNSLAPTTVSSNVVRDLLCTAPNTNTTTTASVIGLFSSNTFAGQTITQNSVYNLSNTTGTAAVAISGLYYTGPTTGTNTIERNFIHSFSLSSTSTTATLNGIYYAGGVSTVKNNMIRLGITPAGASLTTVSQINGIYETSGTNNFYNNSVYIGGTGIAGTTGSTYCFYSTVTTNTRNILDNIFYNARSGGATGKHYAIRVAGTGYNPAGLTSNYNLLLANGATGGTLGFYGADMATIAAWKAATGQDMASGNGDPNYVNPTGTSALVDLHVQSPTPIEAAGIVISSVTDDYDGQTRSTLTPPDIGVDAGNFTASADIFGPNITFTPLGNGGTSNRSLPGFATITDNVGVSGGTSLPRFYYKKSTDNNAFVGNTSADDGWKYVVASNSSSPFSFTVNYSIIMGGSVSAGNIIQYFVVAQDDANNLSSNIQGATASGAPPVQNINGAPAVWNQYTITGTSIAGNVTVPGIFPTLTGTGGLFEAINTSAVTGNITASITGDLTEPGTFALNQFNEEPLNSNFTLTVQPDGTTERLISGTVANGMIRLDGADRVTIDGRSGGSGRYLRFRNTNTSNPTFTFLNDATSNTIRNCHIEGASTGTTSGVILFGTTTALVGNDNNTLTQNIIRDRSDATGVPYNLIYSLGTTGKENSGLTFTENEFLNFSNYGINISSTGNGDGMALTNNSIYQTAPRASTLYGINILAGNGHTISGNNFGGSNATRTGAALQTTGTTGQIYGIYLSVGMTTPTSVQGNTLSNFGSTGTGSSTNVWGLYIAAGMVNVGTVTGNTFGGGALPSDTIRNGYDNGIIHVAAGIVDIQNNLIGNVAYYNAGGDRTCGIYVAGGRVNIKNNIIRDIESNSTSTGLSFLPVGIVLATTISGNVEGNTIYNIQNTNPGTSAYTAGGIINSGAWVNGTVHKNFIYNVSAQGTGTGTNSPQVYGLYNSAGSSSYYNNLISIGQGTDGETRIYGIQDASTGANNYYYNSVNLFGTGSGNNASYGFLKSAASLVTMNDNILYNGRSGGSIKSYAIGASNASGMASNYNDIFSSAGPLGLWGVSDQVNLAAWQTASTGDAASKSVNPNFFSNSDLHTCQSDLDGAGVAVSGITTDFAGVTRGNPPDIGAYEFSIPLPTITGVTPVCAGSTGITYTTESGMTGYSWSISAGGAITGGGSTNQITVTWNTAGAQTVSVNYSNANGCSASTPTVKNVTVNALPVPTISGHSAVCYGATGNVYTTENGMTGYAWTVVGGSITSGGAPTENTVTVTWNTSGSQSVSVNYTNPDGCTAVAATSYGVTVYPAFAVGSVSADQSICYNTAPAQLTGVAPTGGNTPYSYQWQSSTDNVTFTDIAGATSLDYAPGALTQTTYYRLNQTSSTGCGTVTTNAVTITVYPDFIAGLISADQSICYNTAPAQLTGVAPTGGNIPYTYQWQSSPDNVIFTDISGATSLNYQPGTLTQTTIYRLNQTSASGCGTVTTNTVTITIYPDFVVGSISADQSICYNTTPAQLVGVAPTGGSTPYTYQWQSSTDNITFSDITGATSLNYTPGVLTQTTYYLLKQSSAAGCGTLATNTVTITVYPNFTVGSISADQSICYNTIPVQLNGVAPTGGNTPYTYQWQSSADNVTFADITGETGLNYAPGALTQTMYYRLNQTSASGCGTGATNTVAISVYPDFVVGSISADQSICYNTAPAQLSGIAPTGGNAPYSYQWQSSTDNITFSDISGATGLNYQPGSLTQTTWYRQNQSSASGCGTLTTNTVTISVYPNFVVGSISADQSICYNTTPAQLVGVVPTGGNAPYSYQWQSSADNITFADITGATGLNYQPGALTQTTYFRQNQSSASGCGTLSTNTVTITVYPNFVVGTISADQSICYNATPAQLNGVAPTGGNAPYSYQWQSSADNITFANITGATSLNYQPGALTQTTWYRLNQTSSSGCGTGTTNTVTITVYPQFVAGTIASSQSICSNTAPVQLTGTAPTGGDTPYTYQWQSSSDNITFLNITGAMSLTYQPGVLTQTTYYRMNQTSSSGCGTLSTNTVTITVNPLPVPVVTGPSVVCPGFSGFLYSTANGMTGYLWTISAGGTIDAGQGTNQISVSWNTSGAQFVTVTYTDANSCNPASPTTFNVTVNTTINPVITGLATVCAGTSGATYTTDPGNSSYSWTISAGGTITAGGTSQVATVTWNTAGAQSISVTYVDPNGCTVTPTTKPITVNPLPVPTITGPTPVCYGATGNIYTTETGMTGYTWTVSSGGVITTGGGVTDNTVTVAWMTSGPQSVTVNYTNANSCTAASATSYPVTVYPQLAAGNVTASQSICYNTTPVLLSGTAPTGGNTPYTYQWQNSPDNITFTNITGATALTYQPGALTATTWYRLNQTSASGCGTVTTNTVTITVYGNLVAGTIAANQSICYNTTPAQLTGTAPAGGNTPYTYQWQSSPDNITFTNITGAIALTYQPGALTATTWYRLNQTSASGCGTVTTNTVTITVYPNLAAGTIAANQSICYNTTPAQLTGTAPTGGNTPYTYQWQSSPDNITFTNITGATALTYQPVALTVTTYYRLNQTSASGCGTVTTNTVTITVYGNLAAGTITSSQSICYNTAPTLLTGTAPTGGNTPYTYQWQSSTDNITFTDITGATALTYQPGALTVNTYYRLNQTSASGCGTVTTNTVTITVYGNLVAGTIAANQSICYNTVPALLTGTAPTGGNMPYTYQWQSSPDNITFTNITGATALTYQPGTLTATTWYRLNQISASGCGTVTTNTVTITVYPNLIAGTIAANQSICYNTTPALLTGTAPTGGNTPYTYQWQSSPDNITFTDITGATALTFQPGALTTTTYYRLNQTSASGCGTVTTNTVTITVYGNLVAGTIAANQGICYNTTPAQLTGTAPTGGNMPYTYQWQSSIDNIIFANIIGATSLTYQPGALIQTTYYRLNQTSASGCGTVTTNTATITVYGNLVAGTIAANQSICYNTTPAQITGTAPTGGNAPYTYQWQSSPNGTTWTDISGATGINYQPGALTATTYYRQQQTSASGCGTVTTNTVTITVYPNLVAGTIASNQSICYNTTPALLTGTAPTGGNTPYTFQWQSSPNGTTWTNITGATSLNYQPPALTATTYYRLNQTSASGCGTVTTNTVTITVYGNLGTVNK